MKTETYKKECIKHHEKNGDFVQIEGGLYVFFPTRESLGAMGPHHLRWIADELDKRNNHQKQTANTQQLPKEL